MLPFVIFFMSLVVVVVVVVVVAESEIKKQTNINDKRRRSMDSIDHNVDDIYLYTHFP